MNKIIDLRSDTVTRPGPDMLKYMMEAEVGDDVLGDDPTVKALENKAAVMFGKEAAIFCPSGTMTNQIAVKLHTNPGDELICDITSHVYNFEGGGIGFNSGCSVKVINGDRGRMKPEQVQACINPPGNEHYARSRLVVVENTSNKGGGSYYRLKDLIEITQVCKSNNLRIHLDGARIFNALVETGERPEDHGKIFDSVSVCLSKGLGAPVGSLLIGDRDFISQAIRVRKVFGGGMRQSGYLAAAGIFALDHNIPLLKADHKRAARIATILHQLDYIDHVMPVDTNIIVFRLKDEIKDIVFMEKLRKNGILTIGFGPQVIRMVTHLDFTDKMLDKILDILKNFRKL